MFFFLLPATFFLGFTSTFLAAANLFGNLPLDLDFDWSLDNFRNANRYGTRFFHRHQLVDRFNPTCLLFKFGYLYAVVDGFFALLKHNVIANTVAAAWLIFGTCDTAGARFFDANLAT